LLPLEFLLGEDGNFLPDLSIFAMFGDRGDPGRDVLVLFGLVDFLFDFGEMLFIWFLPWLLLKLDSSGALASLLVIVILF